MNTLFKNFNLIDGTGNAVIEDANMVVCDGKIEWIESATDSLGGEYSIVDLNGSYVMPGMIDCHTHITFPATANPAEMLITSNDVDFTMFAVKNLEKMLKNGVTYIREVGDYKHIGLRLKKHVLDGSIKGPNICSAGQLVTMTGGHGHQVGSIADGVEDVRKAVREQLKHGVDLIKVVSSGGVMTPGVNVNHYQFNVEELQVAVEEAHKAGRKVATHCHSTQGVKNSVIAGVDSIEHATILDEEAIHMMVDKGTYIVPTLVAPYNIVKNGEEAGIPKFAVDKAKEISVSHEQSIRMAYEAGVKIAMGTDVGTPFNVHGPSSAKELELMVGIGMKPMDVIVSATKTASELLGVEQTHGTLQAGKMADFLVLSENPLENIKTIQDLQAVYKNGEKVSI